MILEYFFLTLFLFLTGLIVVLIPFFSTFFVFQENYQEKISSYECGFESFENYMQRFEVRYYLLAILFLIFDLELAFLMPWIINLDYISIFSIFSMFLFFFFFNISFLLRVTKRWIRMRLSYLNQFFSKNFFFISFLKNVIKSKIFFFILRKNKIDCYLHNQDLNFILTILKLNTNLNFNILVDLVVTDLLKSLHRFKLTYCLLNTFFNIRFFLHTFIKDFSFVSSSKFLFKSSAWLEREAWDLFGIWFVNNNDLRRILTDYGFKGYPFRKDFPLSGYVELRHEDSSGDIVYEPVELSQELRFFNFSTGWEKDQ